MLISKDYIEQNAIVHSNRIWGASGYSHANTIAKYRKEIKAKTVLDYGCGQATLKKALIKADRSIKPNWIYEYDPAIVGKDAKPDPADLLIATDVLEHIEPNYFDETMKFLRSLAILGAFFTIALTPSKVFLPDGRNAHLIIESKDWWIAALAWHGFLIQRSEMRKGLWVWML